MTLLCKTATSIFSQVTSPIATATALDHRRLLSLSPPMMSFSKPYGYILDDDLAKILKDKRKASSIAVVDVRDDDFVGGNIPGCQHVASTEFPDQVQELVTSPLKDSKFLGVKCEDNISPYSIVFLPSDSRGPKAARMYQEARDAAIKSGKLEANLPSGNPQIVSVLRHGFAGFGQRYKADPVLVENWDEESWKYR